MKNHRIKLKVNSVKRYHGFNDDFGPYCVMNCTVSNGDIINVRCDYAEVRLIEHIGKVVDSGWFLGMRELTFAHKNSKVIFDIKPCNAMDIFRFRKSAII